MSQMQRRRFSRIYLDSSTTVAGAQVIWPSKERTFVVDISYRGAALQKPQTEKFTNKQKFEIEIDLKREGALKVDAHVAWENPDILGVEFSLIKGDGPRVLEKFLSNKLIGSHLFEIAPNLYKDQLDCQFWYHGPSEVDVTIWVLNPSEAQGSPVRKTEIQMNDDLVLVQDGQVTVHHFGANAQTKEHEQRAIRTAAELMSQLKSKSKAAEQTFLLLDQKVSDKKKDK